MKQCTIRKGSGRHMTLQIYQTTIFEHLEDKSMLYAEDSLAKHLALQENEEDFQTLEELCSLRLQEQPNKSNHAFYSLKTSKGFYHTTREKHLKQSSIRWMNWGTMRNGKCLTAKTSEYRKTGKGSLLSDILEEQVDEKYFLSQGQTEKLVFQ